MALGKNQGSLGAKLECLKQGGEAPETRACLHPPSTYPLPLTLGTAHVPLLPSAAQ